MSAPSAKKSGSRRLATPNVALAASVAGVSCLGAALFAVAVLTDSWDSVQFDFAKVNASARASAAGYSEMRSLYAAGGATVVGMVLLANNSTGYCVLNLRGGMWRLCDSVDAADSVNQDYHTHCSQFNLLIRNDTCFPYVSGYDRVRDLLEETENTPEMQIMKMQNNTIACCIVVLLSLATSMITGLIGIFGRVVPAVMVTGVLYLTAGIFVIFSNSIAHEKAARMTRQPQIASCPQCNCYSLNKTPDMYCTSNYRTVSVGWSLAVSWVAAFLQLVASAGWLYLTRRMRIEKSKAMV